jgi:hypothetical protein
MYIPRSEFKLQIRFVGNFKKHLKLATPSVRVPFCQPALSTIYNWT